jgi:cell division septation protein DedD
MAPGPSAAPGGQAPQAAPRAAAAPAPAAPKAAETTSATGGFSVQLSVQPTEEQARKQAQDLRQKYAGQLGGRAPQVQAAEVNGKTLYRIRVGPMSKDNANDLCTRLKAAQGACFVAQN